MANCIKCKAALPDGALFCPMCGKKQASVDRKATKRGNGTGTVYKRGSSWVAEITKGYREEGGKLTRVKAKKCGFRTKREALEYIPMLRTQKPREKDITWRKAYELWFPTHRADKSTLNCYAAAEKYFAQIEFMKLAAVEIDDIQECIDDCPRAKQTKKNMRTVCSLIYKYAVPRGYAPMSMAPYLTVTGENAAPRASFDADQIKKIKEACGVIPYADYIYCMCYLGFRPTEFLGLSIDNYDKKEKVLRAGIKTEAGKNRTVTISPKIQPIIDRLAKDKISGALFCNEEGKAFRYDYFRDEVFYPTLKAIGIDNPIENKRHKYSPHTCRHTFATLMKNIQASDKDKLELIGHASPEMLRYYQDVNLTDLRKITDAI